MDKISPPGSDHDHDHDVEVDDALAGWPDSPQKVCIAGNIGVGKSTLSKALAAHLNFTLCEEPSEENPYLTDFYKDKSLAFKCQIAFLAARFSNNKAVEQFADNGIVQDRGVYEDVIFARMLSESGDMDKRDYDTYLRLFDTLIANLGDDIPDVILYLDVDIDELTRRVKKRGRSCEKGEGGVSREYLTQLARQYDRFVLEMSKRVQILRVDWNEFQSTPDLWNAVLQVYDGKPGLKTLKQ